MRRRNRSRLDFGPHRRHHPHRLLNRGLSQPPLPPRRQNLTRRPRPHPRPARRNLARHQAAARENSNSSASSQRRAKKSKSTATRTFLPFGERNSTPPLTGTMPATFSKPAGMPV